MRWKSCWLLTNASIIESCINHRKSECSCNLSICKYVALWSIAISCTSKYTADFNSWILEAISHWYSYKECINGQLQRQWKSPEKKHCVRDGTVIFYSREFDAAEGQNFAQATLKGSRVWLELARSLLLLGGCALCVRFARFEYVSVTLVTPTSFCLQRKIHLYASKFGISLALTYEATCFDSVFIAAHGVSWAAKPGVLPPDLGFLVPFWVSVFFWRSEGFKI